MRHIDFETKTDRELLILVAQQGNETVDHLAKINEKLLKHERRITYLEAQGGCSVSDSPKRSRLKSTLRDNWQTLSLIVSVLTLIIIELVTKLL